MSNKIPFRSDPNPPQIEKKKSNAQKNWGKIRTAQKMTAVFKEVDKDVKMFGSSKDDSHIDWSEVYKTQERENRLPLGIIDPSSTFRNSWDLFMSFILLYIAFYVPYRVCLFWDDDNLSDNLQTIETISDILFGIDIILNFSTAYVDKKTGELIVSRRKIAIYYCKGYFIIDLVASFPFQILTGGGGQALSKSGKVLRLPKLIKFLRLFRLLKLMRIYRLRQLMTRLQAEYNIHHGFSRMIKIVLMVLLVTHLVGCLWFMIGRTGGDDPIDGGELSVLNFSNIWLNNNNNLTSFVVVVLLLLLARRMDVALPTLQPHHRGTVRNEPVLGVFDSDHSRLRRH